MPTNYVPKTQHLNPSRIQKICKDLIKEAGEDRTLALDAYRFFKRLVEDEGDAPSKQLMVDALKVAQSSKNNVVKILNLIVKMEESGDSALTKANKGSGNSVFDELDSLINDKS